MANRELNVVLGIKLNEFEKGLRNAEKSLDRFAKKAQALGKSLTQNLTLPIVAVGGSAVAAFTNLERMEKGLAAVMGSSEAAQVELRKLQEVAKLPGLGFEQAVQGSIRLQAVGLSADEARETLSAFGAAIAATGGTAQNLESVQYQLTQMISKNRILQEDFSIIQENVPLVGKAIESAFGTRNIEQIRASGISAQEFNKRIVEALKNLPETQNAVGGLGNAFENFTDSIKLSLAEFGRAINESLHLEEVLDFLARGVQKLVDYFRSLSPEAQRIIVITTALVAAIGPTVFIVGKLALAVRAVGSAFIFMTSPIGLTIAAIVGIIAAVGYLYTEFEGVRRVINGLTDTLVEFIKIVGEGITAFFRGFNNLTSGNFKQAAKDFGEAIIKTNPITIAVSQGKRLADAFVGGYEDGTNRLAGVIDKIKGYVSGGGITMPSTGGGGGGTASDATGLPTGGSVERRTAPKPLQLIDTKSLQLATTQITSIKDANKEIVQSMKESLAVTKERSDGEYDKKLAEQSEIMAKNFSFIQSAITPIIDGVFQALEKGTNVFKSITQSVKQLIIQLVKAVAQAAILSAVMNIIFPGAGAAGQFGFKTIFKGLLGFANGGLVTGPTLGLIGEGRGTSMSNPEVVAPLDKLKSMLDGVMGGGDFVASTRLAGSDLLLVVERAQRERGR